MKKIVIINRRQLDRFNATGNLKSVVKKRSLGFFVDGSFIVYSYLFWVRNEFKAILTWAMGIANIFFFLPDFFSYESTRNFRNY